MLIHGLGWRLVAEHEPRDQMIALAVERARDLLHAGADGVSVLLTRPSQGLVTAHIVRLDRKGGSDAEAR